MEKNHSQIFVSDFAAFPIFGFSKDQRHQSSKRSHRLPGGGISTVWQMPVLFVSGGCEGHWDDIQEMYGI